jgi:hypothetical protein
MIKTPKPRVFPVIRLFEILGGYGAAVLAIKLLP